MEHRDVSRRRLLKGGGAALAGLSLQVAARPTPSNATTIESNTRGMTTSLTRRNHWDSPATWSSRGSTSPRRFPPRSSAEASSSGRSSTPGSSLPRSSISSRTTVYRLALTNPDAWRVAVAGLVRRRLSLSLADLEDSPAPRNRLHIGVLRQPWHRAALCHWLHRECPLGRYTSRSSVWRKRVSSRGPSRSCSMGSIAEPR